MSACLQTLLGHEAGAPVSPLNTHFLAALTGKLSRGLEHDLHLSCVTSSAHCFWIKVEAGGGGSGCCSRDNWKDQGSWVSAQSKQWLQSQGCDHTQINFKYAQ